MIKTKNFYRLFFLIVSIIFYAGCSSNTSKEEDENAKNSKSEINAELLKEQNDLYEKVCVDFTEINKKVIELNDKIHSKKEKLTEAFKTTLEEDIVDVKTQLDEIINTIK